MKQLQILNDYSVRYVVIEGTKARLRVLEWLSEEVISEKFDLIEKYFLQSSENKINNIPVSIYEYKEHTPTKDGITLKIIIPLMGETIEVPINDFVNN